MSKKAVKQYYNKKYIEILYKVRDQVLLNQRNINIKRLVKKFSTNIIYQ